MANLNFNEIKIFEKLFDKGGYVLDFNNRTFTCFFKDFDINIDDVKYQREGESKMKRLRAFWTLEPNQKVGEVLSSLLKYAETLDNNKNQEDKNQALQSINRLTGNIVSSEEVIKANFMKRNFKNIDLSLLGLGRLTEIIQQRVNEIEKCLNYDVPLSVIFLCGSTLEGILLNQAEKNPQKFNIAQSSPKDKNKQVKPFQEWTLSNLIDVAYENKFIELDVKKFSHALRDFRNFIHPYQQSLTNFMPNQHTAQISWQVLQAAIDSLSKKRKK